MEPIFFKPSYKSVIWGGNNISKMFNRNVTGDTIGESWEISAHKNGLSLVQNGEFAGKSLSELFADRKNKVRLFGTDCANLERFPILTKFIDANKNLSIQVHPDDKYASQNENDSGKNEVWYVMDCKENAKIVYGLKDNVTKANLKNAIDNIEQNVNYINVHKGDFIPIPSGTVHAIMDGIVICEVQQSSDITYRVYDWNRVDKNGKPRELHKDKALDVINLNNNNKVYNYQGVKTNEHMYTSRTFSIDMVHVDGKQENCSDESTFYAYVVVEGSGSVSSGAFVHELGVGDSFIVPASLGEYSFTGNLKLMKIWV